MSVAIASKWNGHSFRPPPEGAHTKVTVSCVAGSKHSVCYGSSRTDAADEYCNIKRRNVPFVTVNWGDGVVEKVSDRAGCRYHQYPDGVTEDYEIDISDGLSQLGFGEYAQDYLAGIKTIESVGEHVVKLARYAFYGREIEDLSALRDSNVREFGNGAFCYATGQALADLGWMPPVTAVGAQCFLGSSLASLDGFPASVGNEISGSYMFSGTRITSVSGLPSSVTRLTGPGMFSECRYLSDCNGLPQGLKELGEYAFQGCSSMERIGDLPPGLTYIPAHCFDGNPLSDTTGCNNIIGVGSYAFQGCALLGSVSLPAARMVSSHAFYGCKSVESVNAPDLNYLGEYAFSGTSASSTAAMAITTITIDDIRFIYGAYVFRNCPNLKTVYMQHRSVGQVLGTWGYSCNVTRDVTNATSDFPWGLPKGCKIHCRNGTIELTSEPGARTPTYEISLGNPDGYSREYDGVVTITVRVDEPGQIMTLHMADATGGSFPRTDVYVQERGGSSSSTSFSQSSGVFTYTFASAGTYELAFDDFMANVDFRNLGVALIEISSMGPEFSMCENSLGDSEELERVVCWGSTGRNLSRFRDYEPTDDGMKESMRGARREVVFECSNGTLNGDCEEELYEWYLRQRYV